MVDILEATWPNLYSSFHPDFIQKMQVPFLLLLFQFIIQASVDDKQSIEKDDSITLQCNFKFFMSFYIKLLFFYNTNYFF